MQERKFPQTPFQVIRETAIEQWKEEFDKRLAAEDPNDAFSELVEPKARRLMLLIEDFLADLTAMEQEYQWGGCELTDGTLTPGRPDFQAAWDKYYKLYSGLVK